MTWQPLLADMFLNHEKREFKGIEIVKRKQDKSPGKLDRSTRTQDLSPQVSKTKRYSIDEEILYDDVNVYLLMYLIKPYTNYLMRLAAHYDMYERCQTQSQPRTNVDFVTVWKLINLIKSLTSFRQILTHIGRYYLSDAKYIIDFIEAITKDMFYYYRLIEQNV
jgi:hypothetical protein